MSEKSRASLILETASQLIDGDRDKQHGDRHKNFTHIANLWTAYFGFPISAKQVAWAMVLVKMSRDANGEFSRDNAIDGSGYCALAGELGEKAG
jgi:hypothetical protein